MTTVWSLIVLAGVAALADWLAVGTANDRLQYAAKPAVLALLVAAAALIPMADAVSGGRRGWFVIALGFCLVGDVLLMVPRNLFIPGLAAFLAGHAFFIVGLLQPVSRQPSGHSPSQHRGWRWPPGSSCWSKLSRQPSSSDPSSGTDRVPWSAPSACTWGPS